MNKLIFILFAFAFITTLSACKKFLDKKQNTSLVTTQTVADLQALLDNGTIVPMVNQIRFSVGFTQDEIVAFCQKNNILIEAYSPLGTGSVFSDPKLEVMAKAYDVSIAQLCIQYCLEKNALPLPKMRSKDRMIQNATLDFSIKPEDMKVLDAFEEIQRL